MYGLRKIKRMKKDRRQFYMQLAGYVLIIGMAIATNLIGYGVVQNVLESEIDKNNRNVLDNLRIVCDSRMEKVLSEVQRILLSTSVRKLSDDKNSDYTRQVLTTNILKDIGNSIIGTGGYHCGVVMQKSDLCLQTEMGISDLTAVYEGFYSQYFNTEEEWKEEVFSTSGARFLTVVDCYNKKNLFLIYRVPNYNANTALVLVVNPTDIEKLLVSSAENDEQSFVVDSEGNVLFRSRGSLDVDCFGSNIPKFVHHMHTKYKINFIQSQIGELYYLRAVPEKGYLHKANLVRLAFVAGYLLCIFLTGSVAYYLSVVQFARKRKLEEELTRQYELVREDMTEKILKGYIKSEGELLEAYKEMLLGGSFVVVLFELLDKFEKTENSLSELELYSRIRQMTAEVYTNPQRGIYAYFCMVDDVCSGYVKFAATLPDMEFIDRQTESICVCVKQQFGIDLRCVVGCEVNDPSKLHECYIQALDRLCMSCFEEEKSVYYCSEIYDGYSVVSFGIGEATENQMIDAVVLGEYPRAKAIIDAQFDMTKYEKRASRKVIKMAAINLVSALMKAVVQIGAESRLDCNELYLIVLQYGVHRSAEEMKQVLSEYAYKLCEISASDNKSEK